MKKVISRMNLYLLFQRIAVSLIHLFIPVVIYKAGFSLNSIFLFYLVYFLVFSISAMLSFLFLKIGFKKVLILRPFSLIIFYSLLYSLSQGSSLLKLLLIAIYYGIISGPFWVVFQSFFLRNNRTKNNYDNIATLYSLPHLITIVFPLLGAIILTNLGLLALISTATFFLLMSIIPTIGLKEFDIDLDFNLKNLFDRSFFKYILGFFVEGFKLKVYSLVVPIYIYFTLNKSAYNLGFFSIIAGVSGTIAPFIVKFFTKDKEERYIRLFSLIDGILFLPIFFIKNLYYLFAMLFILNIFTNFWKIPFFSKVYRHPFKENVVEFMVLRETVLDLSRTLIFFILYVSNNFYLTFAISSLSGLLFLFF